MKKAIIATAFLLTFGEQGYGMETNQTNIPQEDSKWSLKLELATDKQVGNWNLFETLTPTIENSPITEIKIGFLSYYKKKCNLFSDEQHQLAKIKGETEGAFGGEKFLIKIRTSDEAAGNKILDALKDIHLHGASFYHDLYFQYTNPKKSPENLKDYEKYGIKEFPLNLVWSDEKKKDMLRGGLLDNYDCRTYNKNRQIMDRDDDDSTLLMGKINFSSTIVIYLMFQSIQNTFPQLVSPKLDEAFLELNKRLPII